MELSNTHDQTTTFTGGLPDHFFPQESNNERLSSAELANLWAEFMSIKLLECVIGYFLDKAVDGKVRSVLEYALQAARQNMQAITGIYSRENHPLPRGYTDEDVKLNAPRLFSDAFILSYIEFVSEMKISGYGTALPMAARADIREYFTQCMACANELYNRTAGIMLAKGLYLRAPQIPIPEKFDFAKKQTFLAGFLGERRPLTAIEISHIFSRAKAAFLRKALFTGFAQVTKQKQVRDYMIRGRDMSSKSIRVLSSLMNQNGLPLPAAWDSGVLQSTVAPFSEKLMLQNIGAFNAVEITNYGKAISVSLRRDLTLSFTRLMAGIANYSEDGTKLLIANGWLEEQPQSGGPESFKKKMH